MPERRAVYDISMRLGADSIAYPGDTPFRRERISKLSQGATSEVSDLHMSAHSGTHIDAPAHFIQRGKAIDQYDPEAFVLSAVVVAVQYGESIRPEALTEVDWKQGGCTVPDAEFGNRAWAGRRIVGALRASFARSRCPLCATGRGPGRAGRDQHRSP